ncbi:4-(cytidine 5'-diphospho)-2-C-methyl-D-erythritol kinase [Oryzibacter oryziterrae]|uniref:4-(cytidine 5'-diphospho)-2-C-methyl-D-erythritol kinase n=1 Tax=Oryzibacter oryziterrae TaxID=2766474 RepID=UPI001F00B308|nr:4-(cytidine 5'-diphospho)-2-C-methyl-D-erythritol kinase [Oryzibacter oryziterrae]
MSIVADAVTETGRAKVNLALHVVGRRVDGYHLLETLAVFPDIGDDVHVVADDAETFAITGPMASALRDADPNDNLVLRAVAAFERVYGFGPSLSVELVKRLPVTSGIGGGSADAAATLRALARLRGVDPLSPQMMDVAVRLGADVPMCLHSTTLRATGVGEVITDSRRGLKAAMLLVNPGVAVSTPRVFAALTQRGNPPLPPLPARLNGLKALASFLRSESRNDLQTAAISLAPRIGEVLAALEALPGTALARMSGSGATCFALFETLVEAENAAATLRQQQPTWWIAAATCEI